MIVVGVDGSQCARNAIDWGLRRAEIRGQSLLLVNVVDDDWGRRGHITDSAMARSGDLLQGEIALAASAYPNVPVHAQTGWGDPMTTLAVAGSDADLVVVGTNKGGFVSGQVFGSRPLQLAAVSRRPVAVIPQMQFRNRRSGVAVGIDGTDAGNEATVFGTREASIEQVPLTLLRCVGADATADDDGDAELERAGRITVPLLESRAIHRRVVRAPGMALADASRTMSLVVIGRPDRSVSGRGLGRVAHDLLMNLAGPVIVVPESKLTA